MFFTKDLKPMLNSRTHPCKIVCLDQFMKAYCCLLPYVFSLLIFYNNYFITYVTYLIILLLLSDYMVFLKLFLTVTNIFMLITFTFLTCT